jgi:hypothetical protein
MDFSRTRTAPSAGGGGLVLELRHSGVHGHARPPPGRAPPSASRALAEQVRSDPSVKAKALLSASRSGQPEHKTLHPAFRNLGTLRNKRKSVLAEIKAAALETAHDPLTELKAWQDGNLARVQFATVAVAASASQPLTLSLALTTSFLSSLAAAFRGPLSTEIVDLPVLSKSAPFQAKSANLLATIGFSTEFRCYLPLALTLVLPTDGGDADQLTPHYEAHFSRLWQAISLEVDAQGVPAFGGMVLDGAPVNAACKSSLTAYIRRLRPTVESDTVSKNVSSLILVICWP